MNISKVQLPIRIYLLLIDDEPKVIVNNLEVKGQGDQPLKSGDQTNVPLIASSNANNIYSNIQQLQYGVVV